MRSTKLFIGFFCVIIILLSFPETYSQAKKINKQEKTGNSGNKFFKKKVTLISLGVTVYGKGQFQEKYDGLSTEVESVERDEFFNIDNSDPRPDREKYNKITWTGNSFVYVQDTPPDQSGNSGHLTIAGTLSDDGKMLEKCSVIFNGKPGTGIYKKPEFSYNFEVNNIPIADQAVFPEGVYRLWNVNEEKHNIFSSFFYVEKEFKSEDTWKYCKLISCDNTVQGNGFTLGFIFN